MIHLHKDLETEFFYLSFGEAAQGKTVVYIRWTNRLTGDVIKFPTDTYFSFIATNTNRYSKHEIATIDFFDGYDTGLWKFEAWALTSEIVPTTEPDITGYMYLHGTAFSPDKYDEQDNTFKTYQG